jgi:hypothetical protein
MSFSLLLLAVTLGLTPEQALDRALDAVEPPPALRAAFRATVSSGQAVRRIEFDPYAAAGQQFRVTHSEGNDEELDAIVDGWRDEGQADVRLFADDLRQSVANARVSRLGEGLAVDFNHQISANDGALDQMISSRVRGRMMLDTQTGRISQVVYAIDKPLRFDDGSVVSEYRQTYNFAHSERWGVSYVLSYDLVAKGGRWGIEDKRSIRVTLNDVAFGLAGDANQSLESKPAPFFAGLSAQLR